MKIFRLILSCFFYFSFFAMQGQSDAFLLQQKVTVEMRNGETLDGVLLERNDQFITLENANGKFKLYIEGVKKIEKYSYPGKYDYPNLHNTRYFVAPSAIPLKKGEGFYSNYMIIASTANYGISNNVSIGVGAELVNTMALLIPLWTVNAKAGFRLLDEIHLAGGISLTHQSYPENYNFSSKVNELIAFLPYTVITLGKRESNISLGFSYNVSENYDFFDYRGRYIDQKGLIFSFSGSRRITNKISVMSENNFGFLDRRLNYVGVQGMQLHYRRNNWRLGLLYIIPFLEGVVIIPFFGYSIMF